MWWNRWHRYSLFTGWTMNVQRPAQSRKSQKVETLIARVPTWSLRPCHGKDQKQACHRALNESFFDSFRTFSRWPQMGIGTVTSVFLEGISDWPRLEFIRRTNTWWMWFWWNVIVLIQISAASLKYFMDYKSATKSASLISRHTIWFLHHWGTVPPALPHYNHVLTQLD